MTTLSFSLTAPKMTSLATAAAMVTAASQSSQWPPWTIAGVIFSIVTIVLGIPGAAVAVYTCRKRRRRGRGMQAAGEPNLWF
jgi:phosphotransferase system  glucose/maltose/N-acetylglucosamine-specific IIC component